MADRGSRSRSRAAGMLLRPQPGHGRVGPDGVMYSERSSSRAHRLHALGGRELSHLGTIHERIVGALHGSRSGPTCGTKVDDCIRATAPAYLLLELLSLVCGLGRQEQLAADHECITCMPAESNALRARGDGATALRPHLHQPTRALLVSARAASPGDAASARRRSRTRAVNGTRALRSISVAASGSAERRVPNVLARVHLTAPPQAQSPQATPEHRQRSCSGGRCIVARGV